MCLTRALSARFTRGRPATSASQRLVVRDFKSSPGTKVVFAGRTLFQSFFDTFLSPVLLTPACLVVDLFRTANPVRSAQNCIHEACCDFGSNYLRFHHLCVQVQSFREHLSRMMLAHATVVFHARCRRLYLSDANAVPRKRSRPAGVSTGCAIQEPNALEACHSSVQYKHGESFHLVLDPSPRCREP